MTSVHPHTDVQQVSKGIVQKGQQIGEHTGILVSADGEANLLSLSGPECDFLPNLGQSKGCWSRGHNKCYCVPLCLQLPLWKCQLSIRGSSDVSHAWHPLPFFQGWNEPGWRVGDWIGSRAERWVKNGRRLWKRLIVLINLNCWFRLFEVGIQQAPTVLFPSLNANTLEYFKPLWKE